METRSRGVQWTVAAAFALLAACGGDYDRVEAEPPGEEQPEPMVVPEREGQVGEPLDATADPGQEEADSVPPIVGEQP